MVVPRRRRSVSWTPRHYAREARGDRELVRILQTRAAPFRWLSERVLANAAADLGSSSDPVFDEAGVQIGTCTSTWVRQPGWLVENPLGLRLCLSDDQPIDANGDSLGRNCFLLSSKNFDYDHPMSGVIVIVAYRPKPGKETELLELVRSRVPTLHRESLVTDREPTIMRAHDGTIIEMSEWKSHDAIDAAHKNPKVLAMWNKFFATCNCVPFRTLVEAEEILRPSKRSLANMLRSARKGPRSQSGPAIAGSPRSK